MKKLTKNALLINKLKEGWISHFKACYDLKSGQMGRRIREYANKPPIGFKMEERWRNEDIYGIPTRYKEFRLVAEI